MRDHQFENNPDRLLLRPCDVEPRIDFVVVSNFLELGKQQLCDGHIYP